MDFFSFFIIFQVINVNIKIYKILRALALIWAKHAVILKYEETNSLLYCFYYGLCWNFMEFALTVTDKVKLNFDMI